MASLEQRGGKFRIVFRYRGQKFTRSLNTKSPRAAAGVLARVEDNLMRLELGHVVLPEGAEVATFVVSDGRLEQRPATVKFLRTLGQLLDQFLAELTPGALEPTTEQCIRIHVGHFKRYFGTQQSLPALDLTKLQQYVDSRAKATGLRGRPLSSTTIRKEIATLNMIWTWGLNHKLIDRPLSKQGLRFPKTTDRPPFQTIEDVGRKIAMGGLSSEEQAELWDSVFLTLPEIAELLEHVRRKALHPFLYPMFVFAAHTGARRSEMRRSRWEDIDFAGKRVFLRERKRVRGRHTLRSVPLSPLLADVMKDWLRDHPGGRDTFCLESNVPKSCKNRLEPIPLTCEEAGHHFQQVLLGTRWEKLRGWHVFRHSFCSNCAAKGIDQRMINAWVGHQTEDMVRRYRHLIPNQEHNAIQSVFSDKMATEVPYPPANVDEAPRSRRAQ